MVTSESDSFLKLADEIEGKLANLWKTGFLFDLGESVVEYFESKDVGKAWSFLKSYADYDSKRVALEIFRLIVDWDRKAQSYCAKKWGSTSIQFQKFKRGNERMLRLFGSMGVPTNQIAVSFSQQASEFRQLVVQTPPPPWKRAISYVPDLLRLAVSILAR